MKRAISPVIATVIIVAVTIAIAIAVALWMSGLVGSFTATENIQIISAYAERSPGTGDTNITITDTPSGKVYKVANYWNITLQVKNVGTTDATIDNIFINGKPYDSYTGKITAYDVTDENNKKDVDNAPGRILINGTSSLSPISLKAGDSTTIIITIPDGLGFTSGQMVEVKLHTASGKEYPKQVTLP